MGNLLLIWFRVALVNIRSDMSAISDNLWSKCIDCYVDTVTMSMTMTVVMFALSMREDVVESEKTSKKCWIRV